MVIDTSAVVAILTKEDGADAFKMAIEKDPDRFMSAASLLETSIVLEARFGEQGGLELDLLVQRLEIRIIPVDSGQVAWARHAYRTYGKGRHAAALNFGDCFSYALAKVTGEPLLFKGQDFSRSDITDALPVGGAPLTN